MHQLLTIAYTVPPQLIAIVLGLALLAVASSSGWRWPMLLDAALIALYASRPSISVLALGALVATVRWVAPFAAIVAELLNVPSWGGLSLPVALFALPGLSAYLTGAPERASRAELPPVVVATGKTVRLAETHARTLGPAEWLHACNDDPTAPHLGVVGATQQGKTTFTQALIARRSGELVITTTKSDLWAGADVIRPSMRIENGKGIVDWTPITDAINRVHVEMLRRNIEHDTRAPQLNLIVDEFTTTLGNVPAETKKQILEIWSMGASCGIRTIVIAQEVNARAWGLEGRRDLLGNLQFARVTPGRQWVLGRLGPNGEILEAQPLDTGQLVALAAEAQLRGRGWEGVAPAAAPGLSGAVTPPPPPVVPQTQTDRQTDAMQKALALVPHIKAGQTREQTRADGVAFDNDDWTRAAALVKMKMV